MMVIDNKYNIGDMVYLLTDEEQKKRIVTALFIECGSIQYKLTNGSTSSFHYDFEITTTKQVL